MLCIRSLLHILCYITTRCYYTYPKVLNAITFFLKGPCSITNVLHKSTSALPQLPTNYHNSPGHMLSQKSTTTRYVTAAPCSMSEDPFMLYNIAATYNIAIGRNVIAFRRNLLRFITRYFAFYNKTLCN